jgi:hypothetical protein
MRIRCVQNASRSAVAAATLLLCASVALRADEPDVHGLMLQVNALQSLHDLELTPEQLATLAKLAETTANKPKPGKAVTASPAFRTALTQLRDALVKGDDEKIEQCRTKFDEIADKELVDIDDHIEITPAARQKIPQLMKLLTVNQLASYIGSLDLSDPADRLMDGAEEILGLTGKEKKEVSDEVSKDIVRLVGAAAASEQAKKLTKHVTEFLDRASGLKEEEFKKRRSELEKEAKQIVGEVSAFEVLRHEVNHNLAELLSNPQLEAAIAAKMKK